MRENGEMGTAAAGPALSDEWLRALIEQTLAGIYLIQGGRFRYVNQEFANIFGYAAPADIIDKLSVGDLVAPEDRERVAENVRRRAEGEVPEMRYSFAGRRRDGQVIHVEVHGRAMQFEGRAAVIGLLLDVSERWRAEEQLERYRNSLEEQVRQRTEQLMQARDAADAANRAKSVFLANMSHELRTPLNAILGFAEIVRQDTTLGPTQREGLEIISHSGEHLLKLINDVLEIAKIEAGKLQLEIRAFDLHGLVRDVADMMRIRAQQKGLQLTFDQSSKFPRCINGDEARLRQILVNLVGNAVKYTAQGGVVIRLGVKNDARSHLLIEVEDSGPGISADDQQRLFQPFVQVGDETARQGTGLGLAIARQFARLMDGEIVVDSTPGEGSVFRVDLPLQLASEDEVRQLGQQEHGTAIALAPGQPRYRILIAEDQPENRLLLERLMTDLGLPVRCVGNGEDCVRLFESWQPDLIWLDRQMPVMDGLEAARRIRAMNGGDKVRIVAVTASVFKEQRSDVLAAGIDDMVRKPYRFSEIHDCMARQLGAEFVVQPPAEEPLRAEPLTPQCLSGVPAALRDGLREALESLHGDRIEGLVARIASIDAALGARLDSLAHDFDYSTILCALEALESQEGRRR